MNIRQIRDLALKILGIYYLSNALIYAPQFAGVFTSWGKVSEIAGHESAVLLSVLLPLLFWTGIGLVLTFRSLPELITLALSIVCIVKAQSIETFLMAKIGKDSQCD